MVARGIVAFTLKSGHMIWSHRFAPQEIGTRAISVLAVMPQPSPGGIRDAVRPEWPGPLLADGTEGGVQEIQLSGNQQLGRVCPARGWNVVDLCYSAPSTP